MFNKIPFLILAIILITSGCNIVKKKDSTPTLLKTENATREQLIAEITRFSKVGSMRAKMDLKFEDNSFAQFGNKEVYRSADGEVVVQRPANIYLKVQVPIVKLDVAQMSSDGTSFRVAILNDGGDGKFKKFVVGTNDADYSKLQKTLENPPAKGEGSERNVSAFANLRPQHFTDAMLVRPTTAGHAYLQSAIFQFEVDETQKKNSPLRTVMRGYYLLDEYSRDNAGDLKIKRRFWFDRVGGIRLARQQLFDEKGEIESDIIYGKEGNLTANGEYKNLPLRIQVTRPKEKYTMSLTYQSPESVTIGKTYPASAFVLKNDWGLEEVDLDKRLKDANGQSAVIK